MIPNSDIYHFIIRLLHSNTWMFLILHVQISSTALSLPAWVNTHIAFCIERSCFQQLYMVLNTKSVNNFFLIVSVIVTCNWSSGLFWCSSTKFLLEMPVYKDVLVLIIVFFNIYGVIHGVHYNTMKKNPQTTYWEHILKPGSTVTFFYCLKRTHFRWCVFHLFHQRSQS